MRTSGIHIRLVELCTRTLDVLLHEQQLLHARELLRVRGARQRAAQVVEWAAEIELAPQILVVCLVDDLVCVAARPGISLPSGECASMSAQSSH